MTTMDLIFITGNARKFAEVQAVLPDIQQVDIDLPEIQSLDPHAIIRYKLAEAQKIYPHSQIIVEDTSLIFDAWHGLPGPLIKWYLQTVKDIGLWDMIKGFANKKATALCVIGYSNGTDIMFFEGSVSGMIVEPVISSNFGRDALFQPDGLDITFAHMSMEEKGRISHRALALQKLVQYLQG